MESELFLRTCFQYSFSVCVLLCFVGKGYLNCTPKQYETHPYKDFLIMSTDIYGLRNVSDVTLLVIMDGQGYFYPSINICFFTTVVLMSTRLHENKQALFDSILRKESTNNGDLTPNELRMKQQLKEWLLTTQPKALKAALSELKQKTDSLMMIKMDSLEDRLYRRNTQHLGKLQPIRVLTPEKILSETDWSLFDLPLNKTKFVHSNHIDIGENMAPMAQMVITTSHQETMKVKANMHVIISVLEPNMAGVFPPAYGEALDVGINGVSAVDFYNILSEFQNKISSNNHLLDAFEQALSSNGVNFENMKNNSINDSHGLVAQCIEEYADKTLERWINHRNQESKMDEQQMEEFKQHIQLEQKNITTFVRQKVFPNVGRCNKHTNPTAYRLLMAHKQLEKYWVEIQKERSLAATVPLNQGLDIDFESQNYWDGYNLNGICNDNLNGNVNNNSNGTSNSEESDEDINVNTKKNVHEQKDHGQKVHSQWKLNWMTWHSLHRITHWE